MCSQNRLPCDGDVFGVTDTSQKPDLLHAYWDFTAGDNYVSACASYLKNDLFVSVGYTSNRAFISISCNHPDNDFTIKLNVVSHDLSHLAISDDVNHNSWLLILAERLSEMTWIENRYNKMEDRFRVAGDVMCTLDVENPENLKNKNLVKYGTNSASAARTSHGIQVLSDVVLQSRRFDRGVAAAAICVINNNLVYPSPDDLMNDISLVYGNNLNKMEFDSHNPEKYLLSVKNGLLLHGSGLAFNKFTDSRTAPLMLNCIHSIRTFARMHPNSKLLYVSFYNRIDRPRLFRMFNGVPATASARDVLSALESINTDPCMSSGNIREVNIFMGIFETTIRSSIALRMTIGEPMRYTSIDSVVNEAAGSIMYLLPDEVVDKQYDFRVVGKFETSRLVLEEIARYIVTCALMDPSGHFLKTFLVNTRQQMKRYAKNRGRLYPSSLFIEDYYANIFMCATKVLTDSVWEWLGVAASNVGLEFSPLKSRSNTRVDEGLKLIASIASERKFDSDRDFMNYLRTTCFRAQKMLD